MQYSPEEWETIEREEHDASYKERFPFHFKDYRVDPDAVIWFQDYCFKPGRRMDRGHRTKRVFEIMDINNITGTMILDVGCGNGQYSVLFALLGAIVYGCDISPVGIQTANKMAQINGVSDKCYFSVQNASQLSYPSEYFDIVLMHEALHHIIKYPNIKEEALRVLKSSGTLIAAETIKGCTLFNLARYFTMKGNEAKGDVIMSLNDLVAFAKGFSEERYEMMSLCFMLKRAFQEYLHIPIVRRFLFSLKSIDDFLLYLFPSLQKYCGECVMILKK
jgi:ubiquinone/menaquinone biosynthesis C-methylase UbiE